MHIPIIIVGFNFRKLQTVGVRNGVKMDTSELLEVSMNAKLNPLSLLLGLESKEKYYYPNRMKFQSAKWSVLVIFLLSNIYFIMDIVFRNMCLFNSIT